MQKLKQTRLKLLCFPSGLVLTFNNFSNFVIITNYNKLNTILSLEYSILEYPVKIGIDACVYSRTSRFSASNAPRYYSDIYPSAICKLMKKWSTGVTLYTNVAIGRNIGFVSDRIKVSYTPDKRRLRRCKRRRKSSY